MSVSVRIFGRGLVIVTLQAMNVAAIARGHYALATIGGYLISWVWWTNAHSAGHVTARGAAHVYAAGAAVGTALGMWLSEVLSQELR